MALSETPDLLTGAKGTVFLRRFPLLPASRKIVFKEDKSSCLSGGILPFHTVLTAPRRHNGLPSDEIAEGTRSFSGLAEFLNVGLHFFFFSPYCSNPSPIIIFQIHPFPPSRFSLTAH